MNYRRILVLTTLGEDVQTTFDVLRRLVPGAAGLLVIAERPAPAIAWLAPDPTPELEEVSSRALAELQAAARGSAPSVEVTPSAELSPDALVELATTSSIDLLVFGSRSRRSLALAAGLRKRAPLPLLFPGARSDPSGVPGLGLGCLPLSVSDDAVLSAFLREHASPADRAVLMTSRPLSLQDLSALREVTGLAAQIELIDASVQRWRRLLDAKSRRELDVLVVARFPPRILLAMGARPPVLVLPPPRTHVPEHERAIELPDLLDDGTVIRVRMEYAAGIGRRTPLENQEVALVRGGDLVARAAAVQGELELPSGLGRSLGVFRTRGKPTGAPAECVEARVTVLTASQRPVVLFDAELGPEYLLLLQRLPDAEPVAVRLQPTRSFASVRARLRTAGLPSHVLDAATVLGEGDAPDVPTQADAVRLARVAARMRATGFPVVAIVHRGPHTPLVRGFKAVPPEQISALDVTCVVTGSHRSLDERLDATTASEAMEGNLVEVELDNPKARGWLLSAIEGSRERVHFQVYMALDDDVGHPVEAALAAAGQRGVKVRVLVDSLHGHHGSFGLRNPLLERLSSRPGVEFRVAHPITGAPTLEQMKQRDHRKLVVVDGRMALLGGRNLSHEYYTGFEEVALRPEMTWRMVPWLDGGARVEGPAVAALERAFLQAWTDNGGEPFEITDPARCGTTRARVVGHRGLRDAHGIETYLAMIDTARSHVYAVNGFPLLLEIQHALLRALRRGVRVRTLVGNLTPRHGEQLFQGPLTSARIAATSFVHSRMDALVAAGAECFELVIPRQPSWHPQVGDLRPHVHAKMMSADGRVCTVGSANLDVTAAYWEDELVLVVEDETIARAVEARFDGLMTRSDRFDRDDPAWQRRAEQRRWMRHWPGVLG